MAALFILYVLGVLFWIMEYGGALTDTLLWIGLALLVGGSIECMVTGPALRRAAWWQLATRHRGKW